MSLTTKVLLGLAIGLALGAAIAAWWPTAIAPALAVADPIGALFVNAIRMTVIPLVVAGIVIGVASAPDLGSIGRVGRRAIPTALAILSLGAAFGVLIAELTVPHLPLDMSRLSALATANEQASTTRPQNVSHWIVSLVPQNPVKAAADGDMLPLIVFSLAFALALARIAPERRAAVATFFGGVFDAMLVLVRGVLALAPLGVLALSVALGARVGVSAAGVVASYVMLVCVAASLFAVVVLYPAAVLVGRTPLPLFVRGVAPAQAVAFSARSSLASLPALMEGATTTLRLPREVTHFFLPLAASTFRAGAGVGLTAGTIFLAKLYGVPLGPIELTTIAVTVVLTSFSIPGIPGGSIVGMVPVLIAARIPLEGLGILLALDTIPDMFRTTVNVTGNMVAATIVGAPEMRRDEDRAPAIAP